MTPDWDIRDCNDKGKLKTPVSLVLALLYLSRHVVFLFSIIRGGVGNPSH
jgi:hypothetical protein